MIVPVWKKVGESSHLLAKKTGAEIQGRGIAGAKTARNKSTPTQNQKATHTGTLDPMAEGMIVVLTGEDRFLKGTFSNWKKTYEFEMLVGVSTDSLDLLGLQTKVVEEKLEKIVGQATRNTSEKTPKKLESKINQILRKLIGEQSQTQPQFSAQRIDGQSGFDLAKNQKAFVPTENKIEVFSLQLLSKKDVKIDQLKKEITQKIAKVEGNFRQAEILKNWQETFKILEQNNLESLPIYKFVATVSKRTYIRSLVRDISEELSVPATTFTIVRTQEGPYSRKDCR